MKVEINQYLNIQPILIVIIYVRPFDALLETMAQ